MSDKESVFRIKGSYSAVDSLYLNGEYADVIFVIDGEHLPAHRNILATRNEYFRGMLFGGLQETSKSEITLHVPVEAFKLILKFIYTNEVELPFKDSKNKLKCDLVIEILELANEYRVTDIMDGVEQALTNEISLDNALTLLKYAELYGLMVLTAKCYAFIDKNASILLQHDTFLELPKDLLITLLKRDSFWAPENEIFTAVLAWQKQNSSTDLQLLLPYVRFSLLKTDFILETVKPLQLFTNDEIFEMIANAQNVSIHTNKRVSPTQHPLSHYEFANPADCDQIFYAEKITPNIKKQMKLPIDLVEIRTFNYIRFVIDQSGTNNSNISLGLYTTCDYLNWDLHSQFDNCRSTVQHLTFETCSARCIRIDFFGFGDEIYPLHNLHNFEILNVKKWRLGNIATETMGAELNQGIPIHDHNLLAPRPFDKAIQLSSMAYTKAYEECYYNEFNSGISIRFSRAWPICKIRARFLSKPKNFEIKCNHQDYTSDVYKASIVKTTLDFEIQPSKLTNSIELCGSSIECTHLECFAIPYMGCEVESNGGEKEA